MTDEICLYDLLSNPIALEIDFMEMANRRTRFILEDLMKEALHPNRIQQRLDGGMDIDDL
jgi:hypothetical protein